MDIRDMTEKKLSGEKIYDGKIIRVERDEVRLPDGATAPREVVRHPGAVCVVPLTDKNEVIVVRQYRYPEARVFTEIPAGKLEAGEKPLDCAKRELLEECGIAAEGWTELGPIYTSPGFCDEAIWLFLASGLSQKTPSPDEDEFLDIVKMPYAEALQKAQTGFFRDGKTQLLVLRCAEMLQKN